MTRVLSWSVLIMLILFSAGCVKETYNMDKLSGQVRLSPGIGISILKGDMSLADMVRSVDTVLFDQDKFVRFIFPKDSVINLRTEDFYDFSDMVSFNDIFEIGELSIRSFNIRVTYSLDQIRTRLGEPYFTTFGNLDGTTAPFPAFPSVNLGNIPFPAIENLERAVFSSGYLVISVSNNITASLKPVTLRLSNTYDNSTIGNEIVIGPVPMGETRSDSINLADATVLNLISAEVVLEGSDGNSEANPIDLDLNNIEITLNGRNLKVRSGRVILPPNKLNSSSGTEAIIFDAGTGIEIEKFKILTGNLSYHIQKPASFDPSLTLSLPHVLRNGSPVSHTVTTLGAGTFSEGNISFDNTEGDLGTDPDYPFNKLHYEIYISSESMFDFVSTDVLTFDIELQNPEFDYIKGYFGQEEKIIDPEIIDLDIDEFLSNITGTFFVADPSIKITYHNSFAIPVKMEFHGTGRRADDSVMLELEPFTVQYPLTPPAERDISATKILDKSNTRLPELISMPPEEIRFYGSAIMNPAGDPDHLRNNYVFGNSRILGNVEIEIPMEFRVQLQFTDTLDNFLADEFDGDLNWDDIKSLRVDFEVDNGFPVGLELQMDMYDSLQTRILSSLDASDIILPAPVDADGKSTGITESTVSINLTKEFFSSIEEADQIILNFGIHTAGTNSSNIKMYSDYRINFRAALIINPEINLKMK